MNNLNKSFKKTVAITSSLAVLSTATDWSAVVARAELVSNAPVIAKEKLENFSGGGYVYWFNFFTEYR